MEETTAMNCTKPALSILLYFQQISSSATSAIYITSVFDAFAISITTLRPTLGESKCSGGKAELLTQQMSNNTHTNSYGKLSQLKSSHDTSTATGSIATWWPVRREHHPASRSEADLFQLSFFRSRWNKVES